MLSSSCLQRPIQVVIFFSVFMKKKRKLPPTRSNKRCFTSPVVISFQCVRYCLQIEKRVWSFSRCVRFGVLSQKQTTTLALGLFSRGTSQMERLFFCFWASVMKISPFLLYLAVLHLMVVKSNLKITVL